MNSPSPATISLPEQLQTWLAEAVRLEASDVHLVPGQGRDQRLLVQADVG